MIPGKKLSWKEQKAIEELQVHVKNDLPASLSGDDLLLYQFLKARDFDVDKAEKMLKKHIHWRKAYQVDTILEDFKPKNFYVKYVKTSVLGFEKTGDLVLYSPAGNLDTKDVLKCTKMNDHYRHFIWDFEQIKVFHKEEATKTGRQGTQLSLIFDLDKLTFSNATSKVSVEVLLNILNLLQDNYPETLKALYLINCPSYYVIAFSILKTILSGASLNKFKTLGQNGWKEKLVEAFGEDILPAFLGGNRTDADGNPMCNSFVGHGGKMPTSFYLSNEERYFRDANQAKKVIIPASERKEIQVQVVENGSRIEWEYLIKNKDIGFGLDFHTSDGQIECILPIQKYSTPDGTEKGFYKCRKVGIYFIIFDNSHSWISSKEIEYVVRITKG